MNHNGIFIGKLWKKKSFCIMNVIFILLVLFCVARIISPCREYQYEGSYSFGEGSSPGDTVIYDGISLGPGVYQVVLEYETDTDQVALCNVADGTVFSGGLLSNGEHIYKGLDKTGYEMWLYEGTENLQVVVSYGGWGNLATGSLKIIETNQLWTMLLTTVLFAGVLLFVVLAFYTYDGNGLVSRDQKNAFFWVMVISLIASVPYLCGYNITGADLTYHLQRIEGVKDGLLGGQFPVRLEPEWVYGHGYANGIFYCNTFLYFPALLRILGFPVSISYNFYCIFLNIATAWISYYCFSRMFGKRNIGIFCSGLYTLSIFRIYKLLVTSATGEGTAVTFLPLVLYGLYRIFTQEPEEKQYRTAWVPLMLGLSGLIQSHVLTCEITALAIVMFCVIFIRKVFSGKVFWALVKGAVSSVLVSLWFLVPFLDYYLTQDIHIKHVSARTIQDRGLYFAHLAFHFWSKGIYTPDGENGMQYSHPVGIGLVLVAVLGLFFVLWFSGAFRERGEHTMPFVKAMPFAKAMPFTKATAIIGVVLLFMSLNCFPWDMLQSLHPVAASLISSLQFPNRFLGWGTVCLVYIFGFCLWYFEAHSKVVYRLLMATTAVIGITTSSMYLLDFVNSGQDYFELYNEESMGFGYISGAEYLIEGTDEAKLTFTGLAAGEGVEIREYEKAYLRASIWCVNTTDIESYVDLPLLLYKGYKAVCTDTKEEMQVCAGDNNVVRVLIPPGFDGNLRVIFASPIYWRVSELVSVLVVVTLIIIWRRYRGTGCSEGAWNENKSAGKQ